MKTPRKKMQNQLAIDKIILSLIAVVVMYAAVVSTMNLVRSTKVGYVNSAILMEKHPLAMQAREELNGKLKEWNVNIKTLEMEIGSMNQAMINEAEKLSQKALEEKRHSLRQKQEEFMRYSQAIQEKAVKMEQELMQPVYDQINVSMKDFGSQKGYAMILGTLSGGNILYAEDAVDLTEDFLAYAASIL